MATSSEDIEGASAAARPSRRRRLLPARASRRARREGRLECAIRSRPAANPIRIPPANPPLLTQPRPGAPAAAVSNHPVLIHKLTLMRQEGVAPRDFRRLLKEVTYYIG